MSRRNLQTTSDQAYTAPLPTPAPPPTPPTAISSTPSHRSNSQSNGEMGPCWFALRSSVSACVWGGQWHHLKGYWHHKGNNNYLERLWPSRPCCLTAVLWIKPPRPPPHCLELVRQIKVARSSARCRRASGAASAESNRFRGEPSSAVGGKSPGTVGEGKVTSELLGLHTPQQVSGGSGRTHNHHRFIVF